MSRRDRKQVNLGVLNLRAFLERRRLLLVAGSFNTFKEDKNGDISLCGPLDPVGLRQIAFPALHPLGGPVGQYKVNGNSHRFISIMCGLLNCNSSLYCFQQFDPQYSDSHHQTRKLPFSNSIGAGFS